MIASRLCFLSKIVRLTKDITGGFPVSFDVRNIYHLALKCSFKTLGVNFIGVCFFSPHCRLSRNGKEGNGYTAGDRGNVHQNFIYIKKLISHFSLTTSPHDKHTFRDKFKLYLIETKLQMS